MPSFFNKVFGRKKDDKDDDSRTSDLELLGGKFEDVSPNVSPSATEFPELSSPRRGREKHQEKESPFTTFFRSKSRPASPIRQHRKLDELPHLSLDFFIDTKAEQPHVLDDSELLLSDAVIGERRLTPIEAVGLIRACSQAITLRGLDTLGIMRPHWYSASPDIQRRLISLFIHSLSAKSSLSTLPSFDSEINSTRSPHDVAAVLRWGLRHLQLEGNGFGRDEGWYQAFFDAERKSGYPSNSFSEILAPSLPVPHLELLKEVLEIFSSLAAHAEANGTSGSKLSKVFGLWLLTGRRVETKDDWLSFYDRWERTGRMLEHLFFARIRDEAVGSRMPVRLLELVRKYPYYVDLGSPTTDLKLLPRPRFTTQLFEALFVRLETEIPTPDLRPGSKINPLRLISEAFSASVEGAEFADLWIKITTASKVDGSGSPLTRIFADETIKFLSLIPPEKDIKSPTFALLPLSPASPSYRHSFCVTDIAQELNKSNGYHSKPVEPSPLSPISTDWALFSTSGFGGVTPTLVPLSSTLFGTDTEKTVPPSTPASPPSRRPSKHARPVSFSAAGRKSMDLPQSDIAEMEVPTAEGLSKTTEEVSKLTSKISITKLVQLDEAFVDFWSDVLLDPISVRWPTFIICKLKSPLVPELTYSSPGGPDEGKEGKTLQWLILEQVFTVKPSPPAASHPTSPQVREHPTSPGGSSKRRFAFWPTTRSTSGSSIGSQKNKTREKGVSEMGEVLEGNAVNDDVFVKKDNAVKLSLPSPKRKPVDVSQKSGYAAATNPEKSLENSVEQVEAEGEGVNVAPLVAVIATGVLGTGTTAIVASESNVEAEVAKSDEIEQPAILAEVNAMPIGIESTPELLVRSTDDDGTAKSDNIVKETKQVNFSPQLVSEEVHQAVHIEPKIEEQMLVVNAEISTVVEEVEAHAAAETPPLDETKHLTSAEIDAKAIAESTVEAPTPTTDILTADKSLEKMQAVDIMSPTVSGGVRVHGDVDDQAQILDQDVPKALKSSPFNAHIESNAVVEVETSVPESEVESSEFINEQEVTPAELSVDSTVETPANVTAAVIGDVKEMREVNLSLQSVAEEDDLEHSTMKESPNIVTSNEDEGVKSVESEANTFRVPVSLEEAAAVQPDTVIEYQAISSVYPFAVDDSKVDIESATAAGVHIVESEIPHSHLSVKAEHVSDDLHDDAFDRIVAVEQSLVQSQSEVNDLPVDSVPFVADEVPQATSVVEQVSDIESLVPAESSANVAGEVVQSEAIAHSEDAESSVADDFAVPVIAALVLPKEEMTALTSSASEVDGHSQANVDQPPRTSLSLTEEPAPKDEVLVEPVSILAAKDVVAGKIPTVEETPVIEKVSAVKQEVFVREGSLVIAEDISAAESESVAEEVLIAEKNARGEEIIEAETEEVFLSEGGIEVVDTPYAKGFRIAEEGAEVNNETAAAEADTVVPLVDEDSVMMDRVGTKEGSVVEHEGAAPISVEVEKEERSFEESSVLMDAYSEEDAEPPVGAGIIVQKEVAIEGAPVSEEVVISEESVFENVVIVAEEESDSEAAQLIGDASAAKEMVEEVLMGKIVTENSQLEEAIVADGTSIEMQMSTSQDHTTIEIAPVTAERTVGSADDVKGLVAEKESGQGTPSEENPVAIEDGSIDATIVKQPAADYGVEIKREISIEGDLLPPAPPALVIGAFPIIGELTLLEPTTPDGSFVTTKGLAEVSTEAPIAKHGSSSEQADGNGTTLDIQEVEPSIHGTPLVKEVSFVGHSLTEELLPVTEDAPVVEKKPLAELGEWVPTAEEIVVIKEPSDLVANEEEVVQIPEEVTIDDKGLPVKGDLSTEEPIIVGEAPILEVPAVEDVPKEEVIGEEVVAKEVSVEDEEKFPVHDELHVEEVPIAEEAPVVGQPLAKGETLQEEVTFVEGASTAVEAQLSPTEPVEEELDLIAEEVFVREEIANEDSVMTELSPVNNPSIAIVDVAPVEEAISIFNGISVVDEEPIEEVCLIEEETHAANDNTVSRNPTSHETAIFTGGAHVAEEPVIVKTDPGEESSPVETLSILEPEPVNEDSSIAEVAIEETSALEPEPVKEDASIEEVAVEETPAVESPILEPEPVNEESSIVEAAIVEENPAVEEPSIAEPEPVNEESSIEAVEETPAVDPSVVQSEDGVLDAVNKEPSEEATIVEETEPANEESSIEEVAIVEGTPLLEDLSVEPVDEESPIEVVEEIPAIEETSAMQPGDSVPDAVNEASSIKEGTVIEETRNAAIVEEIAVMEYSSVVKPEPVKEDPSVAEVTVVENSPAAEDPSVVQPEDNVSEPINEEFSIEDVAVVENHPAVEEYQDVEPESMEMEEDSSVALVEETPAVEDSLVVEAEPVNEESSIEEAVATEESPATEESSNLEAEPRNAEPSTEEVVFDETSAAVESPITEPDATKEPIVQATVVEDIPELENAPAEENILTEEITTLDGSPLAVEDVPIIDQNTDEDKAADVEEATPTEDETTVEGVRTEEVIELDKDAVFDDLLAPVAVSITKAEPVLVEEESLSENLTAVDEVAVEVPIADGVSIIETDAVVRTPLAEVQPPIDETVANFEESTAEVPIAEKPGVVDDTFLTEDQPILIENPVVIEEPPVVEEEASVVEEPIAEEHVAPVVGEEANVMEGPIVEEYTATVVEEEGQIAEESVGPAVEEVNVVEEEPILEEPEEPVLEEVAEEELIADESTVPVVEETGPIAEESVHVMEEEPIVEQPIALVEEEGSIVEEEPIVEECVAPALEEKASVVEEPISEDQPSVAEEEPIVEEPVATVMKEEVEDEPVVEEEVSVVVEEKTTLAEEEQIAEEPVTPVVEEQPTVVDQEPILEDLLVPVVEEKTSDVEEGPFAEESIDPVVVVEEEEKEESIVKESVVPVMEEKPGVVEEETIMQESVAPVIEEKPRVAEEAIVEEEEEPSVMEEEPTTQESVAPVIEENAGTVEEEQTVDESDIVDETFIPEGPPVVGEGSAAGPTTQDSDTGNKLSVTHVEDVEEVVEEEVDLTDSSLILEEPAETEAMTASVIEDVGKSGDLLQTEESDSLPAVPGTPSGISNVPEVEAIKNSEEDEIGDIIDLQPLPVVPSLETEPEESGSDEEVEAEEPVEVLETVNVMSSIPEIQPLKVLEEDESDDAVDLPSIPIISSSAEPVAEADEFYMTIQLVEELSIEPSIEVAPAAESEPTVAANTIATTAELPTEIERVIDAGSTPSTETLLGAVQASLPQDSTAAIDNPEELIVKEEALNHQPLILNSNGHHHVETSDATNTDIANSGIPATETGTVENRTTHEEEGAILTETIASAET